MSRGLSGGGFKMQLHPLIKAIIFLSVSLGIYFRKSHIFISSPKGTDGKKLFENSPFCFKQGAHYQNEWWTESSFILFIANSLNFASSEICKAGVRYIFAMRPQWFEVHFFSLLSLYYVTQIHDSGFQNSGHLSIIYLLRNSTKSV